MKIIGLDVGSKTIGVAISDALGWTGQGLTTIKWNENNLSSADEPLVHIIDEQEITQAVIGLPKNMDGSIGERGEAVTPISDHFKQDNQIPTTFFTETLFTE